jgi:hypothetical protein
MSALLQIKSSYEIEGMSPEEIAEDQNLDITAIKAALMQSSSKYRKACSKEEEEKDDLNFSNDQLRIVTKGIYDLALSTEDEHLKGKLLCYIRDDKKGRKEVVKAMPNNTFNILSFNESIMKAKQAAAQFINKPVIEIAK